MLDTWLTHEKDFETQLTSNRHITMFNNTRSFKFGSTQSTVAVLRDGSCLEVRRGAITWSQKFQEAHPEVQQQRWTSLTSWYASLPVAMEPVEEWHTKGGWNGPCPALGTLYSLSTHLAYFMRHNKATAGQILEAFRSYAAYQETKRPHINGDPVICGFFGLQVFRLGTPQYYRQENETHVIRVLTEGAHLFVGAATCQPEWPSVTKFNLCGLRPPLSYAEGDLEFSPEMMYFMGGWPSGTWADIQRVYEAYMGFKAGRAHPLVEEGSIVTDNFLRHMLQTKERVLPWAAFRRLLVGRGLVWSVAPVSLPELIVDPVEVEKPVERRLSFGSAPMEIDEEGCGPTDLEEGCGPTDLEEGCGPTDLEEGCGPTDLEDEADIIQTILDEVEHIMATPIKEVVGEPELPPAPAKVAPSEGEINAFMARVAAQTAAPSTVAVDPFVEIDDLWYKIADEMEYVDDSDYHAALMEEFVTICLRDEYTVAWRTNTFKRIQMRATLRLWAAIHGYVQGINQFLRTYPA
jgi:hypothetical protein